MQLDTTLAGRFQVLIQLLHMEIPRLHNKYPSSRKNTVKAFIYVFQRNASRWIFLEVSSLFLVFSQQNAIISNYAKFQMLRPDHPLRIGIT